MSVSGSSVYAIIDRGWRLGQLILKVQWSGSDTLWEMIKDMRHDHPRMMAGYIVASKISQSKHGGGQDLQWAKTVEKIQIRQSVESFDYTASI